MGGGVESYLDVLLPALAAQGHPQAVLAGAGEPPAGTPAMFVPELARTFVGRAARARALELARSFAPDAIVIHAVDAMDVVSALADRHPTAAFLHDYRAVCPGNIRYLRLPGKPCWRRVGLACFASAYVNGCNHRRPLPLLRSYRRTQLWSRLIDELPLVLVASEHVRGRLVVEGRDTSRVEILPPCIRLPAGPPPTGDPQALLFVGRLVEPKGAALLLDAVALLKRPWTLTICGDGPQRAALEDRARDPAFAGRVRFTGWQDAREMEERYAAAGIVVVPSKWDEAFGLVGVEALARARPVVATRVGGIPEWLEHGRTGLLVDADDAAALAAALDTLLAEPRRAAAMGAAGPASASRFGVESHARRLVGLLEHLGGPAGLTARP